MKNLQDLEEFDKKTDSDNFEKGEYHQLLGDHLFNTEHYPENPYELDADKIKSFILSDRQEVLKMVLDSFPKEEHPKEQDKTWNDCLSEIKEIILNLTNKIK